MEVETRKGDKEDMDCSSGSHTEEKTVEREEGGKKEEGQKKVEGEDCHVYAEEKSKSDADLESASFSDMEYLYPLQQGVVLSTYGTTCTLANSTVVSQTLQSYDPQNILCMS